MQTATGQNVESFRIPSLSEIRSQFPALAVGTVFLDNAGGSQVPQVVIDAVRHHMTWNYVQLGADYLQSQRATHTVRHAHTVVKTFLNAHDVGEVILAASTTALTHLIANAYADARASDLLGTRDEIIVSTAGHEANIGPWVRLASRGFKVHLWSPSKDAAGNIELGQAELRSLLSRRTLLVAFPHVSNILGDVFDVAPLIADAHEAGAKVCVDGVAYAPHRAPDVAALDADWYVYSTYKVFGPHAAALFGKSSAFESLVGPNHYFIAREDLPYKFELGGFNHESAAAIVAGYDYLAFLAGHASPPVTNHGRDRTLVERAYGHVAALEDAAMAPLLAFLRSRPTVTIHGSQTASAHRVSTISFTVRGVRSQSIVRPLNSRGFGCRFGHFYSKRLIEGTIGLSDPDDGVIRISLAHYNTPEEIERLIEALQPLL